MPKQPPPDENLGAPTFKESLGTTYRLADTLAVLTEPFVSYRFGKRYFGLNVAFGVVVLLCWIAAFPRHELVLLRFGAAWLALVAIQSLMARWSHYFGRRQVTTFIGFPILSGVLPLGVHFCRRVLNPLLTFGVGCLIEDRALSLLIRVSAFGQVIASGFAYAIRQADDDARSDAMLTMRSR